MRGVWRGKGAGGLIYEGALVTTICAEIEGGQPTHFIYMCGGRTWGRPGCNVQGKRDLFT